ncbi:MAG: GFA family protein [Solirubrobacteraceae bacterium]
MIEREAICSCGQLQLIVEGEPVRVSVCHCRACQRRTGSAFGFQARFPRDRVRIRGRATEFHRRSEAGEERTFSFCPECGATVYYTVGSVPDAVSIPVGAFADPAFGQPEISVWESRKHPWVTLPSSAQRDDF